MYWMKKILEKISSLVIVFGFSLVLKKIQMKLGCKKIRMVDKPFTKAEFAGVKISIIFSL